MTLLSMAMIDLVRTPDAGYWIASKSHANFNPAMDTCIAIVKNDVLRGGVLFCNWTGPGGSVTVHMGSDGSRRWATRAFLEAVFYHGFIWLDCKKLFGPVPSTAPEGVLDLNYHLGFQLEHLVKDAYPDGDMLLLSMYKQDCKFLVNRPAGHLFG